MPEPSVAETAATPPAKPSAARRVLQVAVTYAWFIAALFFAAGRWDWIRGWISAALSVVGMTALGLVVRCYNPGLMAERARWRRQDTKPFDKVFLAIYLPLVSLQPALAGLDAVRFQWSSMPFVFVYVGAAMFVASLMVLGWAMVVNPYAESSVRIQADRGHKVIQSGPYRHVRHPMYVGMILMAIANPLIWGSLWALAVSGILILLCIWRTANEDQTLRRQLPGYEDYAAHTRYRLLPGVW